MQILQIEKCRLKLHKNVEMRIEISAKYAIPGTKPRKRLRNQEI
jgi:hypothetical protein